jgi:hypothetical protein
MSHDAVLRVFDTTDRLGEKKIGWKWADGRPTISPEEHDAAKTLIAEAEDRIDPGELEHGTIVAEISMVDGNIENVDWAGFA